MARALHTEDLIGTSWMTLKLCNVIDWPWWMILSPWIVAAVIFVILFWIGIYAAGKKQAAERLKQQMQHFGAMNYPRGHQ